MNHQEAKQKIQKLIAKYDGLSDSDKKSYNEQQTKDHFIRPLFEALGWNFEEDVWPETNVSGKRVDYSFKISGITKFFLEAKPLSINLNEEQWAEQAINYSWHKSVPWVILTDFESIKIFNTEWDEPNIQSCQFIEISYKDYLSDERVQWLSREAFEQGVLDREADKGGRRPKKIIDKQLAEDLVKWREILRKNLEAYNTQIDKRKISEYVQKILDRLIFIRTLEDRQIEDHILQPLVREWEENKKSNGLLIGLNKVFRKIDKTYNSGLFYEDACDYLGDKLDAEDGALAKIINESYRTKDKGIRYNFSDIPADIFGSIYEQYLGYIQQEDGKEKKESKRKSQGIYYTPRYIVDYIVQNTVGEVIKGKKPEEIKNLKILDPACGSGSFLIAAYQTLIDHWRKQEKRHFKGQDQLDALERGFNKRQGGDISPQAKMRILLDNIYGVDLDGQAVEIARLNLLMKMVGRPAKLPNLDSNIQEGNSLISGKEEQLEKYFDGHWRDKKPFDWQEKFGNIFKRGGFDVIIGNPPYIGWAKGKQSREDKDYYQDEFKEIYSGKNDIFYYFICNCLKKLKDGGRLSFIVSRYFLESVWAQKLRSFISSNYFIESIIDFRDSLIFEDVGIHTCIITIVNRHQKNAKVKIQLDSLENKPHFINQDKLRDDFWILSNSSENSIINKIEINSNNLTDFFDIKDTKLSALDKVYVLTEKDIKKFGIEKKYLKKFLSSKDITRYYCNWGNKYLIDISKDTKISKDSELYKYLQSNIGLIENRNKKRKENLGLGLARPMNNYNWDKPKLFCPSRSHENRFIIDIDGATGSRHNTTVLFPKTSKNLLFFVAILNSKLFDYYLKSRSKKMGKSFEYLPQYLEKIKIKVDQISRGKFEELSKLAGKIISLKTELQGLDPILDKNVYNEKKEKIERVDGEIKEEVYKLYGLSEEEVKIIEEK